MKLINLAAMFCPRLRFIRYNFVLLITSEMQSSIAISCSFEENNGFDLKDACISAARDCLSLSCFIEKECEKFSIKQALILIGFTDKNCDLTE